MTRLKFETEVEVEGIGKSVSYSLETAVGYFNLDSQPYSTDYDQTRVLVKDDYAVVAYMTIEEGADPPWQYNDGFGEIITKDGDEREWCRVLGLSEYGGLEIEGYDDAMRLYALADAARTALTQSFTEVEIVKVKPDSQYNFDTGAVIFKTKGKKYVRRYKVEFWQWPTGSEIKPHEVVETMVVTGQGAKIKDRWDFHEQVWKDLRGSGEIGEKWAVLVYDNSPSSTHTYMYVVGPWTETDPDEQYKNRAVWIPCDCLTEDIESHKGNEARWARAVELAKQAVPTYCEWANGNCYNIDIEIHKRDTASSEDENYQWVQLMDSIDLHDHDLGGGVYYGDEDAGTVMDEDLIKALALVDELIKNGGQLIGATSS